MGSWGKSKHWIEGAREVREREAGMTLGEDGEAINWGRCSKRMEKRRRGKRLNVDKCWLDMINGEQLKEQCNVYCRRKRAGNEEPFERICRAHTVRQ